MAKAINWPIQFWEEMLDEPTDKTYCAIRLGTVYYEGHYWVDGERVDLRCNHIKIRRGVVQGNLTSSPIKDLSPETLSQLKTSIQTLDALVKYLSDTYNQPVDLNTEVTVVYYQNEPLNAEMLTEAQEALAIKGGRHL